MEIIETSIFTRQVNELLTDDEYHQLQMALLLNPCLGPLISGGGGLRKVRLSLRSHGKRGGTRAIYYWAVNEKKILMLFLYAKNKQSDLTPDQLKILRNILKEEYP